MTDTEKRLRADLDKAQREITRLKEASVIRDQLLELAIVSGVETASLPDVLLAAENQFEIVHGLALTKEGMRPAVDWLEGMKSKREHWFPKSLPANKAEQKTVIKIPSGVKNAWLRDHWNVTEQGQIVRKYGERIAKQMAEAAGVEWGSIRPAAA